METRWRLGGDRYLWLPRGSCFFSHEYTGLGFAYADQFQASLYRMIGLGFIDKKNIRIQVSCFSSDCKVTLKSVLLHFKGKWQVCLVFCNIPAFSLFFKCSQLCESTQAQGNNKMTKRWVGNWMWLGGFFSWKHSSVAYLRHYFCITEELHSYR